MKKSNYRCTLNFIDCQEGQLIIENVSAYTFKIPYRIGSCDVLERTEDAILIVKSIDEGIKDIVC